MVFRSTGATIYTNHGEIWLSVVDAGCQIWPLLVNGVGTDWKICYSHSYLAVFTPHERQYRLIKLKFYLETYSMHVNLEVRYS